MYKTYEQCCLEVGLDLKAPPPELEKQWVAYIGGKAIPATSMNDAMRKSSLYEEVTSEESLAEHSVYFAKRKSLEEKGFTLWKEYLRQEYFHIQDLMYNICYEEAEIYTGELGHETCAQMLSRYIHVLDRVKSTTRK